MASSLKAETPLTAFPEQNLLELPAQSVRLGDTSPDANVFSRPRRAIPRLPPEGPRATPAGREPPLWAPRRPRGAGAPVPRPRPRPHLPGRSPVVVGGEVLALPQHRPVQIQHLCAAGGCHLGTKKTQGGGPLRRGPELNATPETSAAAGSASGTRARGSAQGAACAPAQVSSGRAWRRRRASGS